MVKQGAYLRLIPLFLLIKMPSVVLLVSIEGCGVSEEELGSIQVEGVEVRKVHCRNEYKDIHNKLKDEKLASYKRQW